MAKTVYGPRSAETVSVALDALEFLATSSDIAIPAGDLRNWLDNFRRHSPAGQQEVLQEARSIRTKVAICLEDE